MSKEFIGVVYGGKPVLFPSPGFPAYGLGKKYFIYREGGKVYFKYADGSRERSTSLTPRRVAGYLKRGDWAPLPSDPFSALPDRGNRPNQTPYGGCP
jgi:hypothetical protein